MLSFSSSLSPDCEAFAIFVDEKSNFNDKKNILKTDISTKIRSYLKVLKDKKNESEIFSLDISTKQKCFLIKLKKIMKNHFHKKKELIFSHT